MGQPTTTHTPYKSYIVSSSKYNRSLNPLIYCENYNVLCEGILAVPEVKHVVTKITGLIEDIVDAVTEADNQSYNIFEELIRIKMATNRTILSPDQFFNGQVAIISKSIFLKRSIWA